MDARTLDAYDRDGDAIAAKWAGKPTPEETAELILRYFEPGAATLDVGSGSGRDVHWLREQGFDAEGIERSATLLAFARQRYPDCRFVEGACGALSRG